jgi:predicted Zn-dependent protease
MSRAPSRNRSTAKAKAKPELAQRKAIEDLLEQDDSEAAVRLHLQRVDEALGMFIDAWQAQPEDLFALSWAIQLRLYRGDEPGALGLCTPLAAAVPLRVDHALAQLQALLLMQQNEAAFQAFRAALDLDWEDVATGRAGARLRHYGACAACRLGQRRQARRRWHEALYILRREELDLDPDAHLAQANLSELEGAAEPPAFPQALTVQTLFPVQVISSLGDLERDVELDAIGASNAYLEAAYSSGDEAVRALASQLLKRRAAQGDIGAVPCLEGLARLPIGSKLERLGYLKFLREQDLIAPDEPIKIWGDEGLTEVTLLSTIVDREPAASGLPKDLEALLSQSIELMQEARIDEAEPLLLRLLEHVPGQPVATGNLAALRQMQGRDEEVRQLFRQLASEHPDYLYGRCNLARLLIVGGQLEEAQGLLQGLAERERMHVNDMFILYATLAMLHMAQGDEPAAKQCLASLEPLIETEDDQRRFTQAKEVVDWASPKGGFRSILRRLVTAPPRP